MDIKSANGDLAPNHGKAKIILLSNFTNNDSFDINCRVVNKNKEEVKLRADVLPAAVIYFLDDKSFHLQILVKPGSHQLKLRASVKKDQLNEQSLILSLINFGQKKLELSHCALTN